MLQYSDLRIEVGQGRAAICGIRETLRCVTKALHDLPSMPQIKPHVAEPGRMVSLGFQHVHSLPKFLYKFSAGSGRQLSKAMKRGIVLIIGFVCYVKLSSVQPAHICRRSPRHYKQRHAVS